MTAIVHPRKGVVCSTKLLNRTERTVRPPQRDARTTILDPSDDRSASTIGRQAARPVEPARAIEFHISAS